MFHHCILTMRQFCSRSRPSALRMPSTAILGGLSWTTLIVGMVLIFFGAIRPVQGQDEAWTPPGELFHTDGWTFHLSTAKDASDRIVAIWQYNPIKKAGPDAALSENDKDSLYISRLEGTEWSTPVEVVFGRIASEKLVLVGGDSGMLHVFSQSDCLWHSWVNPEELTRPQAWSQPQCVADGAYTWPVAAKSADGRLNLIFSGRDAREFFFMYSDDDGVTWSSPMSIIQTADPSTGLIAPTLDIGPDGVLHLAWAEVELPQGSPQKTIKYSSSIDQGISWSEPLQLAGEFQSQPTIRADNQGRVHLVWNGSAADHGRYYVSSNDGGLSWSPVEVLYRNRGGLQMPPGLEIDATGVVHTVFTDQERLLYMQKTDAGWSTPVQLIEPGDVANSLGGGEIDSVNLLISSGNELHTLYSRFGFGEILHQWRFVNAPRMIPPAANLLRETPHVLVLPTVTGLEAISPTSIIDSAGTPSIEWSREQPQSTSIFLQPVLLAAVLASTIVGVVILARIGKRR